MGSSLYNVSKRAGWVGSEKRHFLLIIVLFMVTLGGWVRKSKKMCRRNIGMVPITTSTWPEMLDEIVFEHP